MHEAAFCHINPFCAGGLEKGTLAFSKDPVEMQNVAFHQSMHCCLA